MPEVGEVAKKVRSKNAGPFWLTIDVFCDDAGSFRQIAEGLSTERVARALQVDASDIKRFDIEALNVIKISLPRPTIQGNIDDRDMHGAAWASVIAELEIN